MQEIYASIKPEYFQYTCLNEMYVWFRFPYYLLYYFNPTLKY